jgi:O-antigen/teichoic acid export membrane protein
VTSARGASLAQDAAFNAGSFVLRVVGSLVAVAWIARALGPEGQGRFGFSFWVAGLLGQVMLWGLASAMTRFVARSLGARRPEDARQVVDQAGFWLARTVAVLTVSGALVTLAWGAELQGPLLVGLLIAALSAVSAWRAGVAQGLRRFDVVLGADAAYWASLLLGLVPALASEDPVLGAMLAYLVARAAQAAVLFWGSERALEAHRAPGSAAPIPAELRAELGSYALQMAGLALFGAVLWDRSEVAFLKATGSYADIGVYTAAFGVTLLVGQVPASLGLVLVPFVAELQGADCGREAIGAVFRRGGRLLTLLLAGPIVVLLCAAPAVVDLMYGDAYALSAPLLQVLVLPLLLSGVGTTGAKTLVGGGGQGTLLRLTSLGASLKMVLCVALVPPLGALGAAVACAVAHATSLTGEAWFAARRFPRAADAPAARWMRQVGAASLAGAGTLGAGSLSGVVGVEGPVSVLLLQLVGGGVGWMVGVLAMRPLPQADARALRGALPEPLGPWIERLGGCPPRGRTGNEAGP